MGKVLLVNGFGGISENPSVMNRQGFLRLLYTTPSNECPSQVMALPSAAL
jgi:hypothetical protein